MLSSVALSVLLTVLFLATGAYSLLRWASLRTGVAAHAGDPVAELSHLVMSLAMIGMVWGYGGSTSDLVQIVLFGLLSGYFAVRLVTARRHRGGAGCPTPAYHLLMCAAMVWMVAAMPLLMGMAPSDDAGMQMDGMTMSAGSAAAAPAGPTPQWAIVVTVLTAIALVAAAGHWLRRIARSVPAATIGAEANGSRPGSEPVAADTALVRSGSITTRTLPGPAPSTTANRLLGLLTPRADSLCHLSMSVSMAAMLLLML